MSIEVETETLQNGIDEAKQELNAMKSANDADALENVLSHAGDMGRYQKLLFLTMMPFGFFYAHVYYVQMFIAATPERHWCRVPELEHLDMELRRNLSAPGAAAGEEWERCATFDVNWTLVLQSLRPPAPDTPRVPCAHGWEFELTDIPYPTVVSERGWVCEQDSYAPWAQAIFFVGSFFGGILFGWVADQFGRIPALIGSNLIGGIGGLGTIFTTDVWDFILCRFLVGMSFDNSFMLMYILVLEYVGPQHRTWVGSMSIALYFGVAAITLPWLALWLADWRNLVWLTSSPMLAVVFIPLLVPESARWLITRGRVNQAVKVLKKFERVNGTKIPDDVMEEFIVSSRQTKQTEESLGTLLRSSLLRNVMLLMLVVYMGTMMIFDVVVRLSSAFGLDFFLTFSLTSFTEIPAITLLALILDRLGRRNLAVGPMILAGVLILIAIFVPKGIPQASLAIIARFFINMSYTTVIQWSTELLPTAVRASGSSALHMCGYLATCLSPFIVYSERLWIGLPLLILGIMALITGSINIVLPETKGIPMPQTMADGERIIREHSLCGKPEDSEMTELKSDKRAARMTD